ncbi:MAG: repeat-containing protein [Pedosphaera sp.]|nr:repeat-containing protein [Pedosphaera sp.]
MWKPSRLAISILLVAILGGLVWELLRAREPAYQGKSLSAWLAEAYERGTYISDLTDPEARMAIRAMGSNALPALLSMVGARDSGFRKALLQWSGKQSLFKLHLRTADDCHTLAATGFQSLGPDAMPAVPALIKLLDDPDAEVRGYAAYCLGQIGPGAQAAVPELIKMLSGTNGSLDINTAAQALGEIGPAARPAVPLLSAALTNGSKWFRLATPRIALMKIQGESLSPLIERLRDTSNLTNWNHTWTVVGGFGTNAEPAVPLLINALGDGDFHVQNGALRALGQIHMRPEVCIPAMVPFLTSTNVVLRRNAMHLIRSFGNEAKPVTAEIVQCLSDLDSDVSRGATNALLDIDPAAITKAGKK